MHLRIPIAKDETFANILPSRLNDNVSDADICFFLCDTPTITMGQSRISSPTTAGYTYIYISVRSFGGSHLFG